MSDILCLRIRLTFMYIGFCLLVPYSFVLTSLPVFTRRMGPHFYAQYFPLVTSIAVNITKLVMLYKGNDVPYVAAFVLFGVVQPIITTGTSLVSYFLGQGAPHENTDVALPVFMLLSILTGITFSILDVKAFMMAAEISPQCISYLLIGISAGGIIQYPIQRLVQFIVSRNNQKSRTESQAPAFRDIFCFAIGSIILIFLVPVYLFLKRNERTKRAIIGRVTEDGEKNEQKTEAITLIKRIIHMLTSTLGAYYITFVVFPGILLKWTTHLIEDSTAFATDLIFTFVVGDLVGRLLLLESRLVVSRTKVIVFLNISRILFIPIFFVVAKNNGDGILANCYLQGLIVLLLALSNGYGSAVAMMKGTELVGELEEEKNFAGNWLSACPPMGVLLGSLTNLALSFLFFSR